MELIANVPLQMKFVTDTTGEITPLKFKYQTKEKTIEEVSISEIISYKEINYAGIKAVLFICKAELESKESLFELRYTLLTHKWILFRILY